MAEQPSTKPPSTIRVTQRTNRTLYTFLLQHLLKPFKQLILKPPKEPFPLGSPRISNYHKNVEKFCHVHERVVEDIYIYDLTPKQSSAPNDVEEFKSNRRRLYYICGGSWQMPPSSEHWQFCTELARKLPNVAVSIVSPPLAPKNTAPDAFPQLMRLYKRLLQDAEEAHERVILGGDSSGGNIILCLALALLTKEESGPSPIALFALCPSTNFARDNPEMHEVAKHDPILRVAYSNDSATKWRGAWDARDPRVSPIEADVSLLARRGVRVHGVSAGYDLLSPDVISFRDKCARANVEGEWLQWEKQMHCFPLSWPYKLPEAVEGKEWILDVLRRI